MLALAKLVNFVSFSCDAHDAAPGAVPMTSLIPDCADEYPCRGIKSHDSASDSVNLASDSSQEKRKWWQIDPFLNIPRNSPTGRRRLA